LVPAAGSCAALAGGGETHGSSDRLLGGHAHWFSNPIVIKAALTILGLPSGGIRRPYPELEGERRAQLMGEMGVLTKYGER
jgi:hypothetical protein